VDPKASFNFEFHHGPPSKQFLSLILQKSDLVSQINYLQVLKIANSLRRGKRKVAFLHKRRQRIGQENSLSIYSFIIETGPDKPLIDYHPKSTHFGEACQQGLQERLSKKMKLNVRFLCVLRFFSLPYLVISISGHLNHYSAFRLNPVLVSSISSLFSLR